MPSMSVMSGMKLAEWARWLNGWQRGLGGPHRFMPSKDGVVCKVCRIPVPVPEFARGVPYVKRYLSYHFGVACDEHIVRGIMES